MKTPKTGKIEKWNGWGLTKNRRFRGLFFVWHGSNRQTRKNQNKKHQNQQGPGGLVGLLARVGAHIEKFSILKLQAFIVNLARVPGFEKLNFEEKKVESGVKKPGGVLASRWGGVGGFWECCVIGNKCLKTTVLGIASLVTTMEMNGVKACRHW